MQVDCRCYYCNDNAESHCACTEVGENGTLYNIIDPSLSEDVTIVSVLPRLLLQGAAPCPFFVTPCPFEKAEMTPCPFE